MTTEPNDEPRKSTTDEHYKGLGLMYDRVRLHGERPAMLLTHPDEVAAAGGEQRLRAWCDARRMELKVTTLIPAGVMMLTDRMNDDEIALAGEHIRAAEAERARRKANPNRPGVEHVDGVTLEYVNLNPRPRPQFPIKRPPHIQ